MVFSFIISADCLQWFAKELYDLSPKILLFEQSNIQSPFFLDMWLADCFMSHLLGCSIVSQLILMLFQTFLSERWEAELSTGRLCQGMASTLCFPC